MTRKATSITLLAIGAVGVAVAISLALTPIWDHIAGSCGTLFNLTSDGLFAENCTRASVGPAWGFGAAAAVGLAGLVIGLVLAAGKKQSAAIQEAPER